MTHAAPSIGRASAVHAAARWLAYEHLTDPETRQVSASCARLAAEMLGRIKTDDPELTRGLVLLRQAKDAFVCASLADRGRAPDPPFPIPPS